MSIVSVQNLLASSARSCSPARGLVLVLQPPRSPRGARSHPDPSSNTLQHLPRPPASIRRHLAKRTKSCPCCLFPQRFVMLGLVPDVGTLVPARGGIPDPGGTMLLAAHPPLLAVPSCSAFTRSCALFFPTGFISLSPWISCEEDDYLNIADFFGVVSLL